MSYEGLLQRWRAAQPRGKASWHKAAARLRRQIYNADKFYWHQGEKGERKEPDFTKPDQKWFGAAGYALKHRWL